MGLASEQGRYLQEEREPAFELVVTFASAVSVHLLRAAARGQQC